MPVNLLKGLLVEYGLSLPPLVLQFGFNPTTLSRTRTVEINLGSAPGVNRGYDFTTPFETPRVAQGVQMQAEEFSISTLFDATDAMAEGDPIAGALGIEPQLDTLRTMLEPKTQGPAGLQRPGEPRPRRRARVPAQRDRLGAAASSGARMCCRCS